MAVKAYSLVQRKKVAIVKSPVFKQYSLPNGNTVTMLTGKSSKGDKVSVIISNEKEKPCKNGKPRTKVGAKCTRK
jgi:hypothetical protein